jgi:hypothetical protein
MATAAKKTATSTAVATRKSGAIVSIQEQLRKQVEEMNSRVAPATGINIQVLNTKELKLPDGNKTQQLEAVIVDFVSANFFYEGTFDPKNITPPACFALGTNPQSLVPSDNSPVKQSTDCKSCPMNEFGSNGAGKACKNTRVLAVLPADATDDTPIWLLKVSPTGIKNYDAYVRSLASSLQVPPVGVVTTVTFDDNADYATLRFGNPQPNENLEQHLSRQDEARKLLMAEPDVSGFTAAPKAKAQTRTARR